MKNWIPRWYDSAAKRLLPLSVSKEETVNIYACGITPYSAPHIGHARSFVVFDAFSKTLEVLGWKVKLVRNITDIDDKIIQVAMSQNKTWLELSEHWSNINRELFSKLGVRPTFEPKVSESINEIQEMIQVLIQKGHAYETKQGNVYFRVHSFSPTNVAHQPLEGLKTHQGESRVILEDKENAEDFALWKEAKLNEPFWESPWGRGRPGWHIECSAMIQAHFKGPIHIHGGGIDLRFPHHQCEAHQSEAFLGKSLTQHWVHHGSVLHDGQKMAKSLGNTVLVEDLLKKAEEQMPNRAGALVRYTLLATHWQKPLNWKKTILEKNAFRLKKVEENLEKASLLPDADEATLQNYLEPFFEALSENFNTPLALNILIQLSQKAPLNVLQVGFESLGFESEIWPVLEKNNHQKALIIPAEIQTLFDEREKARQDKNYQRSDELREVLAQKGWLVQDAKKTSELKKIRI